MTAPGTILISKMLVPETEKPLTAGVSKLDDLEFEERGSNVLDAAAKGTTDGLHLALNVAAMLISFLALIALMDGVLGGTHNFLAAHGFRWFPAKSGDHLRSDLRARGVARSACRGTIACASATCWARAWC